jgi:hypothetical protein
MLKINLNGNIEEIKAKNYKQYIKTNNLEEIYYWHYKDFKIISYININLNTSLVNKHKLPPLGISNLLEESSHKFHIYSDIYIFKCKKNKYYVLKEQEYYDFYSLQSSEYESDEDTEQIEKKEEENVDIKKTSINIDIYTNTDTDTTLNNIELDTDLNNYIQFK